MSDAADAVTRRGALAAAALMLASGSALAAAEGNAPAASWVQIRSFTLKPEADREEMVRTLVPELVPIARRIDGFVAWYVLEPDPRTWLAVTFWRDQAAAETAHAEIVAINEQYFLPHVEAYPETVAAAINVAEVFTTADAAAATPAR